MRCADPASAPSASSDDLVEQDRELVPAQARGGVRGSQAAAQSRGHRRRGRRRRRRGRRVVDHLEVVEVHEHHRDRAAARPLRASPPRCGRRSARGWRSGSAGRGGAVAQLLLERARSPTSREVSTMPAEALVAERGRSRRLDVAPAAVRVARCATPPRATRRPGRPRRAARKVATRAHVVGMRALQQAGARRPPASPGRTPARPSRSACGSCRRARGSRSGRRSAGRSTAGAPRSPRSPGAARARCRCGPRRSRAKTASSAASAQHGGHRDAARGGRPRPRAAPTGVSSASTR